MPLGPGKYDELATLVRVVADADGVVLIVLGGCEGSGFSVQGPPEVLGELPALLRLVADGIEQNIREEDQ